MYGRQSRLSVPNNRKGEIGKKLKNVKAIEGRKGKCLFVVDENGRTCGNPVDNNCHVIPESSILDRLKDSSSGKVLELKRGIRKWEHVFVSSSEASPIDLKDPDTFEPESVGTGGACVGWFACKGHDNEFWPIDVKDPDFNDPHIQLLCLYRAFLYEVDMNRLSEQLVKVWNRRAQTSPDGETRFQWNKLLKNLSDRTPKAKETIGRLGKIWYDWKMHGAFNPDAVSGQTLSFSSSLRFAACGLYGKGLVVTVLPVGEHRHKMGIFNLADNADSVNEDKERLTRLSGDSGDSCNYGVSVLAELMTNGWGTIAASPESYRELCDGERREIQTLLAQNSGVDTMVKSLTTLRPQPRGAR